ncbi:MAG TPA: zinc-ribbon domain-containing protein [Gaiellaceae bacterium]|nr:zinc-ribbon domain-containing protein [Gaiellaceae bacterium]
MRRARCETCGAKLPANARFCPACGAAVGSGDTVVQPVPPTEDGPTPVEQHVSERHYFGVPPGGLLLVLGILGVIAAIALFATGGWPWGLIALGLSLFLLTGFVSAERHSPGGEGRATRAFSSVRSRAGVAKETIAAKSGARIELVRLRRDASGLAKQRSERARALGEAVYARNTAATKELKQQMKEIDEGLAATEAQMAKVTIDAHERVGKAKLQTQPTQVVAAEPPDEAPDPAQVPGPYPRPDEDDRPHPPEIPEPTPRQGSE